MQQTLTNLPDAPAITVLDGAGDIPGLKVPADLTPAGGMVGGHIDLFRDNIGSEAETLRTIVHELLHFGLDPIPPREQDAPAMLRLATADTPYRSQQKVCKRPRNNKAQPCGLG